MDCPSTLSKVFLKLRSIVIIFFPKFFFSFSLWDSAKDKDSLEHVGSLEKEELYRAQNFDACKTFFNVY